MTPSLRQGTGAEGGHPPWVQTAPAFRGTSWGWAGEGPEGSGDASMEGAFSGQEVMPPASSLEVVGKRAVMVEVSEADPGREEDDDDENVECFAR